MTITDVDRVDSSPIEKALTVSAGIAGRDAALATKWVNRQHFTQHNLASHEGVAGLEGFVGMLRGDRGEYHVVRVFQDGPFVWTHSEGDIFGPKVFFDVFRFDGGLIVEHWDNLAEATPPNVSGHTAIDGPTEVTDLELTEQNKSLVREFFETAFVEGRIDNVDRFFDGDALVQHNAHGRDGLSALRTMIQDRASAGRTITVDRFEKVLGQGNYVLLMLTVTTADGPAALYELFRVADGKIAEHWDVLEAIPDESEWRNNNGKF